MSTIKNSRSVVSTAKVQKIWEQFTTSLCVVIFCSWLFRLQKYKKFESNSQPKENWPNSEASCFDCKSTKNLRAIHNRPVPPQLAWHSCFDCKSTKNLRAIHNTAEQLKQAQLVVSTAKVQKIWEQFTTNRRWNATHYALFRLQKYKKFESNSQQRWNTIKKWLSCFDCKSTKNLRAIHNKRGTSK